ncbi:maleylacetoacetate isomerase [Glaciimonas immobilis]|uniref:Maleylpyruvate isomerase n=1 Tax=Glaciimonas immobilis TaxID=728004 RepID=A0A840RXC0_9BURK|nr:maleylacetoacetate isomerase [Glaciimonas immobilis]KAF3996114.1 maleylacetoacetate isomerase [Glaciimonas immobilis]MBB5201738.1 maleylpyruvate isomerase [Glaciimonas immobilis]
MKLYSYFRSSAAYRVRIALNLKELPCDIVPVHLIKHGGEQLSPMYRQLNPSGQVPTMVDEDSSQDRAVLTQSLAIIEYLEEMYPHVALLPKAPLDRAFVRSIALMIACDIHPINNLRVLRYLKRDLKLEEDAKNAWYRHWCVLGLTALEATLAADPRVGKFCFGDTPTVADCCLVPQIFNAKRQECDLSAFPTLTRINDHCLQLDAFIMAAPENQIDAEI